MQQQPQSQRPHPMPSSGRGDPISGIIGELQTSWRLFTDPRVPVYAKALPVLIGLVYLLMPADVLPDPLLGLGQVDDLGLLAIMVVAFRFLAGASIGTLMLARQQPQPSSENGASNGGELVGADDSSSTGAFWPEGGQPQGGGSQSEPPRINYNIYSPRASGKGYCGLTVLVIALLVVGVVVWPPIRDTVCWAAPWINPDLRPPFCPKPPEPIDTPIIRTLRTVSKLELVNMTSADVIEVELHGCIFGTEKLLYIATGKAIVGIDFEKLSENDISVDELNKRVTLRLPPPELFDAFPDVDHSRIYRYDKPLACPNNAGDMVKTAQVHFKKELEDMAQSEETLKIAEKHVLSILKLFLVEFGFSDIQVTFSTREIEVGATPPSPAEAESPPAATGTTQSSETPVPIIVVTDTPAPPPTPIDTPAPASTPVPVETASP